MKKLLKLTSFVLCILLLLSSCAKDKVELPEYPLDESLYTMSDNITGATLSLNGVVVAFPLEYEEFKSTGWKLASDQKSEALDGGQYSLYELVNGENRVKGWFANFTDEKKSLSQCTVCGIEADTSLGTSIELPRKVVLGKSEKKAIEESFPNPLEQEDSYVYGEKATGITTLKFDENNVLNFVSVMKLSDPRYLNASKEVPEQVEKYKAPDYLSSDLDDFTFYLYGKTYTMPLPISALVEAGWVKAMASESYLLPGEIMEDAVKLTKANRTLSLSVKNLADYPTIVENCFVTAIESTSSVKLDLVIANSYIRVGNYESAITSAFDENDFTEIKKTKKKTEYIYEDGEKGRITITVKNSYINNIKIELI